MRLAVIFGALLLAGCQTAADVQAGREAHLRSYLGMPMGKFVSQTGLVPAHSVPTSRGRTFVAYGPSVTIATPAYVGAYNITAIPAVARTQTCRVTIDAVLSGAGSSAGADAWEIDSITRDGPCDGVL